MSVLFGQFIYEESSSASSLRVSWVGFTAMINVMVKNKVSSLARIICQLVHNLTD